MPATDGRQGRRFRRALIKTISTAAAALSALALAACTSSAGTSSPPATASGMTAAWPPPISRAAPARLLHATSRPPSTAIVVTVREVGTPSSVASTARLATAASPVGR